MVFCEENPLKCLSRASPLPSLPSHAWSWSPPSWTVSENFFTFVSCHRYPTTMLTLWFLLIFLGARHKFSQYFSHVVDPLTPVTEATMDLVACCPLAHLCTNSGPLGNIYKSHKYARLFSPPRGTLTTLVLLMCGDVEPNPGPVNNAGNIFPCSYCGLNVGWSMEGVCCDNCSV